MNAPTIVQLGRTGDELNIFPCLKHMHDTTGIKPRVVVCREYLPLFDRISYAEPIAFDGTVDECATALDMHPGAMNCMMFGSSPNTTDKCPKLLGFKSWCRAQWALLGYAGLWGKLPLVFDRRDEDAEAALKSGCSNSITFFRGGMSSPPTEKQLESLIGIIYEVAPDRSYNVIGPGFRAPNIVDFIGVLEESKVLITSDSAFLHLNRATKTPCIHFGRGGWESSGYVENVIFHCQWAEIEARRDEIKQHIEKALQR